jgi:sugar lactone lactonase YvrE
MHMPFELTTVAVGLSFGEAPRWRSDGLYFADMHANQLRVLRLDGTLQTIASFAGPISGLGWLPDNRLLAVSMHDRRVLRREPDGFVMHADLSAIATGHANDMVVAADGTAFVGNFGFSLDPPGEARTAAIAKVSVDGKVSVAATDLAFPNGMVITPDGATLIVAESRGRRLTAFDLSRDGSLSRRREWAALEGGAFPDGICLDEEGAIWVASPSTCEVLRIVEGGKVVDRLGTEPRQAIACMLGGSARKTLFVMSAQSREPSFCRQNHTARIEAATVKVAGAGLP